MGLFKKKEKVPELPQLPELPPIKKDTDGFVKNRNELPTLPKSNFGEDLNQEIVKSAVNNPYEETEVEQLPKNFKLNSSANQEKDYNDNSNQELIPPISKKQKMTREISDVPESRALEMQGDSHPRVFRKETEPIFVRIDKFQDAQKTFEDIQKMAKEMAETQKKIRDMKIKEDAEIDGWAQDIDKVQARLREIDENIFDKL